jgi:hypothetical protein
MEDEIVTSNIALLVGEGRVGSYAEPKAAELLKAGWHVLMMQGREERVAEGS